jgi:hypothetical protein
MKFREWLSDENREDNEWWAVSIGDANSYSAGHHGFGDEPEEPAGDCYDKVKWNLPFLKWPIAEVESLLRKAKATVHPHDSSFNSYHECQVSLYIEAHVRNEEIANRLAEIIRPFDDANDPSVWKAGRYDSEYGNHFPFTTFKKAILESIQRENRNLDPPKELVVKTTAPKPPQPYRPKPNETGDDYWQRIMKATELKANMEKRLDPLTREGD